MNDASDLFLLGDSSTSLTGIDLRSIAHHVRRLHHWATKEPVVFSDPITMLLMS